jgi:hypothetical protein
MRPVQTPVLREKKEKDVREPKEWRLDQCSWAVGMGWDLR